jgi:hypothetical protein
VSHDLLIASIERAGDHAAVVGVLVLVAAASGLVYGLVRVAGRSRARSARRADADRRSDT